jgi:hypothetical protein
MTNQTFTSKPKNIQANGTWESKFGMMYQFDIEMEDGKAGQYSSPKYTDMNAQDFPFKVGVEREYAFEITTANGKEYPKIKLPKKDFQPSFQSNGKSDDRERMIVRQSSLARATDILIHNCGNGAVKAEDVMTLAEIFTKYVMKAEPTPEPIPTPEPTPIPEPTPEPIQVPSELAEDDLPF